MGQDSQDLQDSGRPRVSDDAIRRAMARAADALLPDYSPGGELTAFTALDGVDWAPDQDDEPNVVA